MLIAILCFVVLAYAVGFPASAYLDRNLQGRIFVAPMIGLALYAGLSGIVFKYVPLTMATILGLAAASVAFSLFAARQARGEKSLFTAECAPPYLAIIAAIIIAALPTGTVVPHLTGNSISLGAPIFDHAKAAIIDEIANNGSPPHNPFASLAGSDNVLNYYYLWYLVAAAASIVTKAPGWQVDPALTYVTALFSILTVTWLAVGYSGRRAAAWWVIAICLIGQSRYLLAALLGPWLGYRNFAEHGFETWIIQASWVPQHLFAATAAIVAILLIVKIFESEKFDFALCGLVGLISASVYGSSVWVALGFALIVIVLFVTSSRDILRSGHLATSMLNLSIVAGIAGIAASPFLIQQAAILGKVHTIGFWIYPAFPGLSQVVNWAAYWILILPLDFGFIYLGSILLLISRKAGHEGLSYADRVLLITAAVPLVGAQFIHSVVANNDLGWRIVLLPVLAMMVMSSAFMASERTDDGAWLKVVRVAMVALVLTPGIMAGLLFLKTNELDFILSPEETSAGRDFVKEKDLWEAVRAVTPVNEAIADNPADLSTLTMWPGNIGWALLSQRRNCGVGGPFLWAFRPGFSRAVESEINGLFLNVFAGRASDDDLQTMRDKFLCRTLVVTPRDGLWASDLLVKNHAFKIVSETSNWKILRAD